MIIGGGPEGRTIVHMIKTANQKMSITLIKDAAVFCAAFSVLFFFLFCMGIYGKSLTSTKLSVLNFLR